MLIPLILLVLQLPQQRELSSPDFDSDTKKNRILSGSLTESDISDISFSEPIPEAMAANMDTHVASDVSAQFTLQVHMQKIASLMKDSFEPQISHIIQESFQQQVADLVKSIVEGVLAGKFLHLKGRT